MQSVYTLSAFSRFYLAMSIASIAPWKKEETRCDDRRTRDSAQLSGRATSIHSWAMIWAEDDSPSADDFIQHRAGAPVRLT
jgi:hypothetical protein